MLKPALEAIDFQVNDEFPVKLDTILTRMKEARKKKNTMGNVELIKAFGKEIERLIKQRFGMWVIIPEELANDGYACIYPFQTDMILSGRNDPGNIPENELPPRGTPERTAMDYIIQSAKDADATARSINNQVGTIDLRKAYVTGYLGKLRHLLVIDFVKMFIDETPIECITGIILHELGHAFTGLEHHHKLIMTNREIETALEGWNDNIPKTKKMAFSYVFSTDEMIEEGLNENSTIKDFAGACARKLIGYPASQYIGNLHNFTSFEYLADQFATRFGRGLAMMEPLFTMEKEYMYFEAEFLKTARSTSRVNNMVTYSSWGFVLGAIFIGASAGSAIVVGGIIGAIVGFAMSLASKTDVDARIEQAAMNADIYDDRIFRKVRIKQDMIQVLKNTKLDKATTRSLVAMVKAMDKMISETTNTQSEEVDKVRDRDEHMKIHTEQKRRQQETAKSLNNSIFAKAARMRTL